MFKISDPNTTVLVELSTQGTAKLFAFPPNEERALTVGSDARAELRVTGLGVAPVQFHLERRVGTVCLIPAYGLGDLRVNTGRVSGPIPLEERNVIEFGEVRIDATVLVGDRRVDPTGDDDTWSHQPARISEPPGDGDTTQIAMRAITNPVVGIDQQTTAVLRPVNTEFTGPQQTERMAPYRPEPIGPTSPPPIPVQTTERMAPVQRTASNPSAGPLFTTLGTEIMAPFRPSVSEDPDSPPPTARTQRIAPVATTPARSALKTQAFEAVEAKRTTPPSGVSSFSARAEPTSVASPPIVPIPVVPVTIVPPRKAETAAPFADQAADSSTTLFEVAAVRAEQRFADSRSREVTPTAVDMPSPIARGNDETPSGIAKTGSPTSRTVSWIAKLGLLAKARPVLVACGATTGAFLLAAALLVSTRLIEHQRTRPSQAAKTSPAHPIAPPRELIAAPPASPTPIQILETAAPVPTSSATRPTSSPIAKKTPNDPELTAAVADVIAGRYSEARTAYAALSQRTGNTATYAALARLLARAGNPECLGNNPTAPKDCPGVHR